MTPFAFFPRLIQNDVFKLPYKLGSIQRIEFLKNFSSQKNGSSNTEELNTKESLLLKRNLKYPSAFYSSFLGLKPAGVVKQSNWKSNLSKKLRQFVTAVVTPGTKKNVVSTSGFPLRSICSDITLQHTKGVILNKVKQNCFFLKSAQSEPFLNVQLISTAKSTVFWTSKQHTDRNATNRDIPKEESAKQCDEKLISEDAKKEAPKAELSEEDNAKNPENDKNMLHFQNEKKPKYDDDMIRFVVGAGTVPNLDAGRNPDAGMRFHRLNMPARLPAEPQMPLESVDDNIHGRGAKPPSVTANPLMNMESRMQNRYGEKCQSIEENPDLSVMYAEHQDGSEPRAREDAVAEPETMSPKPTCLPPLGPMPIVKPPTPKMPFPPPCTRPRRRKSKKSNKTKKKC